MKKNFFKKLALVMAMTLAVGSVPATNASAAATPGFKSTAVNVKVGQTKKYNTVNASKYSVKFVIGNKSVASIYYSKGSKAVKVTGVAEGTTRMRAEFKSYKTKKVTTVKIPVTVKPNVTTIQTVAQKTTTQLAVTFNGDASAVTAADFSVTRDSDKMVIPVKGITVDKNDNKLVTIDVFTDMKDGKTYTLTYKEKALSFVATDGKVAAIEINPTTIPYATETEIKAVLKDMNGVQVDEQKLNNSTDTKLEFNVTTTQGYVTGSNLVLLEKGNTAEATAKYHTYDYDTTTGVEKGVVEVKAVITAVDPEAVSLAGMKYTVAKKAPNFDKLTTADTRVAVGDTAYNLYYQIKDSKNNVVTDKYVSVASSDENTLLVNFVSEANGVATVSLAGLKVGTAYVLVKDAKDNVVASFAVNVAAERKATVLEADVTSVTLSKSLATDSKDVEFTLKDQYGDKMDAVIPTVELKTKPADANDSDVSYTPAAGKVTFSTTNAAEKGTYVFMVTEDGVSRAVTVNVAQADANLKAVYKLSATSKVDTTVTDEFDGNNVEVKVSVKKFKGNVEVTNDATITSYTVKDAKGKTVASGSAIGADNFTVTALTGAATGGAITKNLKAGSYSIEVKYDGTNAAGDADHFTATTGFVVVDNQSGLTAKVTKSTSSEATIEAAVAKVVEFYYEGKKIDNPTITNVDSVLVSGDANKHGNIKVTVNVTVGSYIVPIEVTLGQTITINK